MSNTLEEFTRNGTSTDSVEHSTRSSVPAEKTLAERMQDSGMIPDNNPALENAAAMLREIAGRFASEEAGHRDGQKHSGNGFAKLAKGDGNTLLKQWASGYRNAADAMEKFSDQIATLDPGKEVPGGTVNYMRHFEEALERAALHLDAAKNLFPQHAEAIDASLRPLEEKFGKLSEELKPFRPGTPDRNWVASLRQAEVQHHCL